jgi:hypothetical protein
VGMLLVQSEKAKALRAMMLDIVIDVFNQKLGGKTKYINQREEEFLPSAIREFNYRKEFTEALKNCIIENTVKYSTFTDKIYKSIFKENAKEYRKVLNLGKKDNLRETMYSEVLDLIAAYENGFAKYLRKAHDKKQSKLSIDEATIVFKEYEELAEDTVLPLREKARSLMASRDLALRESLHQSLEPYVKALSPEDFEKFLGEKSMELKQRVLENQDVFKRLKDR